MVQTWKALFYFTLPLAKEKRIIISVKLLNVCYWNHSIKTKENLWKILFIVVICSAAHISINRVLIRLYPGKQGWPDLPYSASNLSHSHSPSNSIFCILLLQTNTLTLLLHLWSPCLPRSSSLPLSVHFKLQYLNKNLKYFHPNIVAFLVLFGIVFSFILKICSYAGYNHLAQLLSPRTRWL